MESYLKGLIQIREEKKDEFHVYLYLGSIYKKQAILYGNANKKAYLKGLGIIKTNKGE